MARTMGARAGIAYTQGLQGIAALALLGRALRHFGYSGEFGRLTRWTIRLLPFVTSAAIIHSPTYRPKAEPVDRQMGNFFHLAGIAASLTCTAKGELWLGATSAFFLTHRIAENQGYGCKPIEYLRLGLFLPSLLASLRTKPLSTLCSLGWFYGSFLLDQKLTSFSSPTESTTGAAEEPLPEPPMEFVNPLFKKLPGPTCVLKAHLRAPLSFKAPPDRLTDPPDRVKLLQELHRTRAVILRENTAIWAEMYEAIMPWFMHVDRLGKAQFWHYQLGKEFGVISPETVVPDHLRPTDIERAMLHWLRPMFLEGLLEDYYLRVRSLPKETDHISYQDLVNNEIIGLRGLPNKGMACLMVVLCRASEQEELDERSMAGLCDYLDSCRWESAPSSADPDVLEGTSRFMGELEKHATPTLRGALARLREHLTENLKLLPIGG